MTDTQSSDQQNDPIAEPASDAVQHTNEEQGPGVVSDDDERLKGLKSELDQACHHAKVAAEHLEQRLRVGARFIQACQEQSESLDKRAAEFESRASELQETAHSITERIQAAEDMAGTVEKQIKETAQRAAESQSALEEAVKQSSNVAQPSANSSDHTEDIQQVKRLSEGHEASIRDIRQGLTELEDSVKAMSEQVEQSHRTEADESSDSDDAEHNPEQFIDRLDHALNRSIAPLQDSLVALQRTMEEAGVHAESEPEADSGELLEKFDELLKNVEARIMDHIEDRMAVLSSMRAEPEPSNTIETLVKECIDAINTNDPRIIEQFVETRYSKEALQDRAAKHRSEIFLILFERTGGLSFDAVAPSAEGCDAYATAVRTGTQYRLAFALMNTAGLQVKGVRMDPVDRPVPAGRAA